MLFSFEVTVEVERVSGRFVTRDAIADELISALQDADVQQISVDDSEYETVAWDVNEVPLPTAKRRRPLHAQ